MLQRFFLESPYLLLPACAVAAYVLLVVHLRRQTPRTRRALIIGLLICIALPIVQAIVKTPRERIAAVCRALIAAVEKQDARGVDAHVARTFQVRAIDRKAFMEGVERRLREYQIENALLHLDEVRVDGDKAVARFRVTARFVTQDGFDATGVLPWTVEFIKEDGQWRIQAAEPRPTQWWQVTKLEEVL